MIKLYDAQNCAYGQKVRIALAEKGLSYETIPVDLAAGENRRAEFLRLNPYGRVPVLVDEDVVIYDSTIINEYLDDEYPTPPLLPRVEASAMRASSRTFEDFADNSFTPQADQLLAELAKPEGEQDVNRVQRLRQAIERVLDYLNRHLQGRHFLADEFSVADIAFVPRLLVLGTLGIEIGAGRPHVEAWARRLFERPSVRELRGLSSSLSASA
jgi:glutathione S-transferase